MTCARLFARTVARGFVWVADWVFTIASVIAGAAIVGAIVVAIVGIPLAVWKGWEVIPTSALIGGGIGGAAAYRFGFGGAERIRAIDAVLGWQRVRRVRRHLGPDILDPEPDLDAMLARLRTDQARAVGDALLDQRLVAGIGNLWKAESLWEARVSPWRPVGEVSGEELREVLAAAHRLMAAGVEGARPLRRVYRRRGRACPRCGTIIRSYPQGEGARTAYWCPGCQRGGREPKA